MVPLEVMYSRTPQLLGPYNGLGAYEAGSRGILLGYLVHAVDLWSPEAMKRTVRKYNVMIVGQWMY